LSVHPHITSGVPSVALDEGAIILPRKATFWAACAVVSALVVQGAGFGAYVTKIDARFEAIEGRVVLYSNERIAEDTRILKRGDDRFGGVIARLEGLERDRSMERDRLVRLEEQSRAANELLREIRQDLRAPVGKR
jgi:hypothetical protein